MEGEALRNRGVCGVYLHEQSLAMLRDTQLTPQEPLNEADTPREQRQ